MKTSEIASRLNGKLTGDPDLEIASISDLATIGNNQLGFLAGIPAEGVLDKIPKDACLLVSKDNSDSYAFSTVRVENPKTAFARIAEDLIKNGEKFGIHESLIAGRGSNVRAQFIGSGVSIGANTVVGDGACLFDGVRLGDNVEIGAGTVIHVNASIYDNCIIGANSVLHAGTVIGAPGFGYVRDGDEIIRFPQIGKVVIGDRVEIGANTCVDRAALGDTRIDDDTKIDNLVQVAHNVKIGKRVLIAALVGISGSVVIEDDVVIGGQVGIGDHVTIKSGAVVGGGSGIFPGKIVRAGMWAGTPARPIEKYLKEGALISSLSRLKDEVKELKQKLNS